MSDYIEREAALRRIESCAGWSRPSESAYEDIQAMPAADVVPVRHGHWYDVGSLSCRCSACGCKNNKETAYCPNCGAKMDKGEA